MEYRDMYRVFQCAKQHYSEKKWEHAKKVCEYVEQDPRYALMSIEQQNFIRAVAIAHDVIEDTKCSWSELQGCIEDENVRRQFYIAVDLLTHRKPDYSYEEYVAMIVRSKNLFAIMVKQADMKDHLYRRNTLSDKLKRKYEPVIPLLLGID